MHEHLDLPLAGQLSHAADVIGVGMRADDASQVVQVRPIRSTYRCDPAA